MQQRSLGVQGGARGSSNRSRIVREDRGAAGPDCPVGTRGGKGAEGTGASVRALDSSSPSAPAAGTPASSPGAGRA